jgi:hypothetical protein
MDLLFGSVDLVAEYMNTEKRIHRMPHPGVSREAAAEASTAHSKITGR